MILRPAGSSPAFAYPPANHARSKLSPQAMTAIAMSLVFHAMVGAYLFAHHFTLMTLPTPQSEPPLVIRTVTFPPPAPQPKPTHEKQRTPHPQPQEPIHILNAPHPLGPTPGPAIETPAGPTVSGGGQGLTEVVPTPVIPPPTLPKPKTILNPDWISKPSGAQLADAYPDRALNLGIAGSATLLCTVGVDGQVRDCQVAAETPKNMGFGAAALRLSRWFKIRPKTEDGQAVDGALVRVPIQFGVG